MLGAAVFFLRARSEGWIPVYQGRLMHAAFFQLLKDFSPSLSRVIHDEMNNNPFTVSGLEFLDHPPKSKNGWKIAAGAGFTWRVSALHEAILRALESIEPGRELRVGKMMMTVERRCMGPEEHPDSGVISEDFLIEQCMTLPPPREITLRFIAPTTFRLNTGDYPWPGPGYVFGSLADRWARAGLPAFFDRQTVSAGAELVVPRRWRGETLSVEVQRGRCVSAFSGSFTYDLRYLSEELGRLFLLLAQFGTFSGVGRLTGQGFGQVRVQYRS